MSTALELQDGGQDVRAPRPPRHAAHVWTCIIVVVASCGASGDMHTSPQAEEVDEDMPRKQVRYSEWTDLSRLGDVTHFTFDAAQPFTPPLTDGFELRAQLQLGERLNGSVVPMSDFVGSDGPAFAFGLRRGQPSFEDAREDSPPPPWLPWAEMRGIEGPRRGTAVRVRVILEPLVSAEFDQPLDE